MGDNVFNNDKLNDIIDKILECNDDNDSKEVLEMCKKKIKSMKLGTSEVLIIVALITGTLKFAGIEIDRRQNVFVILSGSLRKRTKLDKMMDEVGQQPFEQVLATLLARQQ